MLTILLIAAVAAVSSPLGGAIALWRRPSTLFMSSTLGFASGVLFATIAFEMLPEAVELGGLPRAGGGFVCGFLAVYALDLFVHRGRMAGKESEQRPQVEEFHRRQRPRGGRVTVLASGTSAEELIEGLSIGVGGAIDPRVGVLIALAILIDNVGEGLSIGQLMRVEDGDEDHPRRGRILVWTSLIGVALLASAMVGWFALRGLPEATLGFLFAVGAGGMFYLTVSDLVPEAEERHYQQSAAVGMGVGFVLMFFLASSW